MPVSWDYDGVTMFMIYLQLIHNFFSFKHILISLDCSIIYITLIQIMRNVYWQYDKYLDLSLSRRWLGQHDSCLIDWSCGGEGRMVWMVQRWLWEMVAVWGVAVKDVNTNAGTEGRRNSSNDGCWDCCWRLLACFCDGCWMVFEFWIKGHLDGLLSGGGEGLCVSMTAGFLYDNRCWFGCW